MEEQNNNAPQTPPAQPPLPAAKSPARSGSAFWVKLLAALYAVSILTAYPVITRMDAARTAHPKESELTRLAGLSEKGKDAVGVVPIYGVIAQGDSSRPWDRGSQQIAKQITNMAKRKAVKAIVLDINSPGGSVGAVQEIYSAIMKAKAETHKPFIARFGEVSASGGYYVASACDQNFALPGTITGSIGVIFSVNDFAGLMKKIGMENNTIKSGKFKDIGSPTRPMTPEERKLLQGMIDDSYDQFVHAVALGRHMTVEQVKTIADGRVFTGRQASGNGLVDKLGDLQDAIDAAGLAANIGRNPRVVTQPDPFQQFFSMLDSRLSFSGTKAVTDALESAPTLEYRWYGR